MDYKEKYTFGQQQIVPNAEGVVSIRGFLYQTPEGHWVLAQEPNLKSCCTGAKGKVMEQIYVEGELPKESPSTVTMISGIFSVDPKRNEKGELIQYYTLKQASVETLTSDWMSLAWIGAGIIVSLIFFRYGKGAFRKI